MTLLTKINWTRQFLYQGVRAFNRNNIDNKSSEQNSAEQYSTQQNRIDRDNSEQNRKNTEEDRTKQKVLAPIREEKTWLFLGFRKVQRNRTE